MIATITLNPSIDQAFSVERLVKDDANRALSVTHHPGGKGVNVSKVVRELGGPTRAFTLQAGFIGQFWAHELKKLDVPFTAYPVKGETRVNTILTDIGDHTQTRISAPGPCAPARDQRRFLEMLLKVRPKPFCWVIGGSPARGMDPSTYRRYIDALQKTGVPCALDADDESLRLGVKAKPFMIKPNEFEMQRLTGKKLSSVESYHEAAEKLVKDGIRIVIVSLAARGAIFVTKDEAILAGAVDVPAQNKVGAGDSLVGGFLLGLYRKQPLEKAAALGIAASTSAVMRAAPRHCRRADIPGLLKRVPIRRLR